LRQRVDTTDDHLALSASRRRIASSMVNYTFRRLLRLAEIGTTRTRRPRIMTSDIPLRPEHWNGPPAAGRLSRAILSRSQRTWVTARLPIPIGTCRRRRRS
jgi:hypothetical protein